MEKNNLTCPQKNPYSYLSPSTPLNSGEKTSTRAFGFRLMELSIQLRIKRPPCKKVFQTLEAYNSKTKCSRTKLTCIKHPSNSNLYRKGIFATGSYVKEWLL